MSFNPNEVADLLVRCHRRCCICHRFCGVKMETDHIEPRADEGLDLIDNAIPVCFECHAEIHSYNDRHPRGRKFTPAELRAHKEQWLNICKNHPEVLLASTLDGDVGPLQALIDELCFNELVAKTSDASNIGCSFHDWQFRRAIQEGAIGILMPQVRDAILAAYRAIGSANQIIPAVDVQRDPDSKTRRSQAAQRAKEAEPLIVAAKDKLMEFLASS